MDVIVDRVPGDCNPGYSAQADPEPPPFDMGRRNQIDPSSIDIDVFQDEELRYGPARPIDEDSRTRRSCHDRPWTDHPGFCCCSRPAGYARTCQEVCIRLYGDRGMITAC